MLRKQCGFEAKFAEGATDGTFSGYGAVFGNEDQGGDLILKGAFRQTLADWRKKGKLPKMLLQHGGGWGSADMIPIGVWTSMEEDDYGLKCEGRLIALDTDRMKLIYAAMKEGGLDGLSIGFRAKEFTFGTKPTEPYRTIKRADLLEVSVVLFGMNELALVDSVKGRLPTEREFEDWLKRDAGFTSSQAKTIVSSGFKALKGMRDADRSEEEGLAEAFQNAARMFRAG